MTKKSREIKVCPNCGHKIVGKEHLPSGEVLAQNVGLDYDPIAGRFLCPNCNYSGLPIWVHEEDYSKITFENRKIVLPLARSNPTYWQLIITSIIVLFISQFMYSWLFYVVFAGGGILLLYTLLRVPKYRKSIEEKQ